MLTRAMRERLEALAMEFTTQELVDLGTFLKMVREVKAMTDGELVGLKAVLDDKGNPETRWNLARVLEHEMMTRHTAKKKHMAELGRLMANYSSDLPAWKDVFPVCQESGTMVPPDELERRLDEQQRNLDNRSRCIYRPTKPQPGDE